ncbi:hypothetical protein I4U23_027041 [Adineta vaga]|nr:hypothetical protein I4U23_027041 [Adineta vaga]
MYETSFSGGQWVGMIGIGSFLWGTGVMIIRHGSQILFASPNRQLLAYFISFPMIYTTLVLSEMLLGIRTDQRLVATTTMSTTALFLDGAAMMWSPHFYEDPSLNKIKSPLAARYCRQGAAWLLWTFGAGFAIALYTHLN